MKFMRVQLSTQAWETWDVWKDDLKHSVCITLCLIFGSRMCILRHPHPQICHWTLQKVESKEWNLVISTWIPHRMTTPPTNLVTSFLEQPAVCRFSDLCFRSNSFSTDSLWRFVPSSPGVGDCQGECGWCGLIADLTKVLRLLSEHPWGNDGDPTGCSLLRGHWIRFWGLNKFPASFWKIDKCKKKMCLSIPERHRSQSQVNEAFWILGLLNNFLWVAWFGHCGTAVAWVNMNVETKKWKCNSRTFWQIVFADWEILILHSYCFSKTTKKHEN